MKIRHAMGILLAGGSLLLAACGDDNDMVVPPTNTPVPTSTNTRPPATATRTVTPAPPTATHTATVAVATATVTNTPEPGTPTNTVPVPPTATITPTVPITDVRCGNGGTPEPGEECDDGNNFGGDGCAPNCTSETAVDTSFRTGATCTGGPNPGIECTRDSACQALGNFGYCESLTGARVQYSTFSLGLGIVGTQTLRVGKPRNEAVKNAEGTVIFQPGQVPVTVRANELSFEPVVVPGVACACVRAVEDPAAGPGNAGSGILGCGDDGLADVNITTTLDHVTNDEDPNCERGIVEVDGRCVDSGGGSCGRGEECTCQDGPNPGNVCTATADCDDPHGTTPNPACKGEPVETPSGQGARGSAVVRLTTAIFAITGVAQDEECEPNPANALMGPDGVPCTDDDPNKGEAAPATTTTGMVAATILDAQPCRTGLTGCATSPPNSYVGTTTIGGGGSCGSFPCISTAEGAPFNCDLVVSNPSGALSGGRLVGAFGILDSSIGDNVVTTGFAFE
jgi:cysteine-rich repeat protein